MLYFNYVSVAGDRTPLNNTQCCYTNRKKAEEEERLRKEAEAEAAAQIAELDRQLKVQQI